MSAVNINGPKAGFGWKDATVKVRVPVWETANVTMQEIEMPLVNLFTMAKALYEKDLSDAVAEVVLSPITLPIKVVEKVGDIMTGDSK